MGAAQQSFAVVIPARMTSSRLPGKPLREIAGVPMILRVRDVAERSGAARVCVATDDARIAEVVAARGGEVVMTSPDHVSGTDRVREAVVALGLAPDAVVVNLQGDEPGMDSSLLRAAASRLTEGRGADIATVATPVGEVGELFDPNAVKVVVADDGAALYFSRAPIPWVRGAFQPSRAPDVLPAGTPFLRHVGLYAYRVATLHRLSDAPPAALELAESLEQLRALALGMRISVLTVPSAPPAGVDTEDDLARMEAWFRAQRHG